MVIISSAKISTKCPFLKSTFNQNTAKKGLRTLPNSVIDLFVRVLWNSCNKTSENIYKNIRSGALFSKNYTTDTFLVAITKEKKLKKNALYSCPFFTNIKRLQSRNFDFNKNRLQEKCFLRAFWNTIWNILASKKKLFIYFSGVFETLGKISVLSNFICSIYYS